MLINYFIFTLHIGMQMFRAHYTGVSQIRVQCPTQFILTLKLIINAVQKITIETFLQFTVNVF